jgi:hypothetical protein
MARGTAFEMGGRDTLELIELIIALDGFAV